MMLFRTIDARKNRYGPGRAYAYFLLFFFLIGALISVNVDRQERRVDVNGRTYVYRGWQEDRYVFETNAGESLYASFICDQGEHGRLQEVRLWSEGWELRRVLDAESWTFDVYRSGEAIDRYDVTAQWTQTEEGRLVMNLTRTINERRKAGLALYVILNLIFTAVGSAYLFFPKTFWRLTHFLHVKGGEPTPFFYFTHAIGGLGFLIFGVGFALFV